MVAAWAGDHREALLIAESVSNRRHAPKKTFYARSEFTLAGSNCPRQRGSVAEGVKLAGGKL